MKGVNRGPLGGWKDVVQEYMCYKGVRRWGKLEQARRECLVRERWKLVYCGHSQILEESKTSEL